MQILRKRDGIRTRVELLDGRSVSVINIAWGHDLGVEAAHITTNISPSVEDEAIDFFHTNEVRALVDPETEAVLYEPPETRLYG